MLQGDIIRNRLNCKIEFSEEEEKPEIISLSSVDDAIRFEDRYEALELLGQGAHAVVKLAKKKGTNDLYAVKITRMSNEEIYNNVKRTFNNARCLRHPNIVQEIELFINEKYCTACLVMEYSPYPSLEKIIKERLLREDETRQVIKQLLLAVMHCHSKGISHRDIKPDNILVNIEGDCSLKLIDFGVSRRFLIKNQQNDMLTKTGNVFYAAPEIYHHSNYSKEVDVWSIGVVMYQCLTGRLPLHSDNMADFIELLRQPEEWNFLSQIRGESLSAQNLISRLLEANPRKRIGAKDALNHPFIEKNQIYTTLASLTSNKAIQDEEDDFANKCKSLQTSLNVNSKSKWHRVFKTLHLGEEYQDIVLEDLIQELGNIHIVQKRDGNNCQGFIQLVNSLGNSQGVTISKKFDSSSGGHCNLGIGSSESIASSGNPTQDYFGDLCNVQSSVDLGDTGHTISKQTEEQQKKSQSQFFSQIGGRIECSIDVNLTDSVQEVGINKLNQIISTLDVMNIRECDEFIEDQ